MNVLHRWALCATATVAVLAAGGFAAYRSAAPVDIPGLSACTLENASDDTVRSWGQSVGFFGEFMPSRLGSLSCKQGWRYLVGDSTAKAVQSHLLGGPVYARRAFREGLYSATLGTRSSIAQRTAAAELGLFLEDMLVTREATVRCSQSEPEAVALVGQLDYPFAVATFGVRANIGDPETAQRAATSLIERVKLMGSTIPAADCKPAVKETFLNQVKVLQQFYQGQHPWTGSCRVVSDTEGLKLTCGAPASASASAPASAP